MLDDALLGAAIAFCLSAITTPVGVSGAVFLVPVQVSILHTPNPALTSTNLLYNLVAIPGALVRFHSERRLSGRLLWLLSLGTLPGVVAGAIIRVELLSGPEAFLAVIAVVLIPLGAWLLLGQPAPVRRQDVGSSSGASQRLTATPPLWTRSGALRGKPNSPRDTAWAMSEENVEVVRQLYDAWNRGDLQSVLKLLTSDFEFRTAGIFPDLDPVYRGREGFRELWESFREGWEIPVAVERIEPVGDDRVLALLRYQARGRGGVEVKREYAQVVTLEDGMVSRIVGFADQEDALEAAGLSE